MAFLSGSVGIGEGRYAVYVAFFSQILHNKNCLNTLIQQKNASEQCEICSQR